MNLFSCVSNIGFRLMYWMLASIKHWFNICFAAGCRCTRDLAHVCIAAGCRYTRDLVCAVCVVLLSWVVAVLTVLCVAWLVTLMGRSMFWYTHFYAAVSLYGSAAAGMILLIHTLAKSLYYRVSEGTKHTTHESNHDTVLVKRHQSLLPIQSSLLI